MSILGTNLQLAIQRYDITQAHLAEASGLTPAAISQIISGEREPMLSTLLKLCTALRTTPNDLLDFHAASASDLRADVVRLREAILDIQHKAADALRLTQGQP